MAQILPCPESPMAASALKEVTLRWEPSPDNGRCIASIPSSGLPESNSGRCLRRLRVQGHVMREAKNRGQHPVNMVLAQGCQRKHLRHVSFRCLKAGVCILGQEGPFSTWS